MFRPPRGQELKIPVSDLGRTLPVRELGSSTLLSRSRHEEADSMLHGGSQKIVGAYLGVLSKGLAVFWGIQGVPLFSEMPFCRRPITFFHLFDLHSSMQLLFPTNRGPDLRMCLRIGCSQQSLHCFNVGHVSRVLCSFSVPHISIISMSS